MPSQLIRKLLSGLTIPQQYICLGLETVDHPLKVMLNGDGESADVTDSHLFLGYKPLLLAFPLQIKTSFRHDQLFSMDFISERPGSKPIATLMMRVIHIVARQDVQMVVCQGAKGSHRFISGVHQWVQRLREKLRRAAPGNVTLEGNLLDQVRIAYAIPRIISLISVKDADTMNLFPTDLHGPIGHEFYVGSLRINGKATEQVERYNDIVMSEIESKQFRFAYNLGGNHMKDLRPVENFILTEDRSRILGHPLPVGCVGYRELRRIDSFDIGIHRVHLYKVLCYTRKADANHETLAHIHQYYAQWRLNNGFYTRMLIR